MTCKRHPGLLKRGVPEDVVEASRAYGATELRVLTDVQLPLAKPSIMAGLNQTLMLAIAMVGIAAIMGASGLGLLVFRAVQNLDVGLGISSGLALWTVAVVLDFGAECARHRGSLDEQLAAFRQRSEAGDQRHRADMARLYENMARLRGGGNVGALRREEEDLRQRYEAALERLERLLGVDGTGEDESDDDLIGEDVDGVLV